MKKISMIVVMFLFILSRCTNEADSSKETDKTKDE